MRHEIVKSRKARSTTPGSSHAIDSLYLPEGEYLIIHYGDEINAGDFFHDPVDNDDDRPTCTQQTDLQQDPLYPASSKTAPAVLSF